MPKPKGRPSSYKPSYCDEIVNYMKDGRSLISFAAHIGVHSDTVYEWGRKNPDFSAALKKAKEACCAYWEDLGHKASLGEVKNFQASAWIFNMKNRFGWRDQVQIEDQGLADATKMLAGSVTGLMNMAVAIASQSRTKRAEIAQHSTKSIDVESVD